MTDGQEDPRDCVDNHARQMARNAYENSKDLHDKLGQILAMGGQLDTVARHVRRLGIYLGVDLERSLSDPPQLNGKIPPQMRERLQSTHDLEEFAERVAKSAIEGFKRPDTTPEEQVRAVVAEEEKAREERRELDRLRKEEAARLAQEKQDKEDSRKRRRGVVADIVKVIGGAGAIEILRWLTSLHH